MRSSAPCVYVYQDIRTSIHMDICLYVLKRVDISIMDVWYASDVMGYDRRTPELANAPLHIT